jgi:hypothetical protein
MVAIATRWQFLEGIIERSVKSFVAVGKALLTIRDQRLYREDFNTFADFCHMKWGLGRHYAQNLITGSQVATNLLARANLCTPCEIQPTNEFQIRPFPVLSPKNNARYGRKR